MPRKYNEILNDLDSAMSDLKQTTLTGPDYTYLDVVCEEWLVARGFSVKAAQEYSNQPKAMSDLPALFYSCFKEHYPNFIAPYNGEKQDLKMTKIFVERRMAAESINKVQAMAQCADIIEAMFRYKDHLDFDPTPTYSIFGAESMIWMVDKIIGLMNKNKLKIDREKLEHTVEMQTRLVEKSLPKLQELNDILGRDNG